MRATAAALRKLVSKHRGDAVFGPRHPPLPTSHTLSDINAYNVLMKVLFGKLTQSEAMEFSEVLNAEAPNFAATLFNPRMPFPPLEVVRADPQSSSRYAKLVVREAKRMALKTSNSALSDSDLNHLVSDRPRRKKVSRVPPLFCHSHCRMGNYNGFFDMLTDNGRLFTATAPDPALYGDLAASLSPEATPAAATARPATIAKLRSTLHKGSAVSSVEIPPVPESMSAYTPARDLFMACLYNSSGSTSLTPDRIELMKMAFVLSPYQNTFLPPNMTRTPTLCRSDQGEVNDVPAFERFCLGYLLEAHKQHAGVFQRGLKSPVNLTQSRLDQHGLLDVNPDRLPILDMFQLFRGLTTGPSPKTKIQPQSREVPVVELFSSGTEKVMYLLRRAGCDNKRIDDIAKAKNPLKATLDALRDVTSTSSSTPELLASLSAFIKLFKQSRHSLVFGTIVRPSALATKVRRTPPTTIKIEERPYAKKRLGMEKIYRRTMFRLGRSLQSKSTSVAQEVDSATAAIVEHEASTPLMPDVPKTYQGAFGQGASVVNNRGVVASNDGEEGGVRSEDSPPIATRVENPVSFQKFSDGMIRRDGGITMATSSVAGRMFHPEPVIPGVRLPAAKEAALVGRILERSAKTGAHMYDSSSAVLKQDEQKRSARMRRKPQRRVKRYKSPTAPPGGSRSTLMDFLVTSLKGE